MTLKEWLDAYLICRTMGIRKVLFGERYTEHILLQVPEDRTSSGSPRTTNSSQREKWNQNSCVLFFLLKNFFNEIGVGHYNHRCIFFLPYFKWGEKMCSNWNPARKTFHREDTIHKTNRECAIFLCICKTMRVGRVMFWENTQEIFCYRFLRMVTEFLGHWK